MARVNITCVVVDGTTPSDGTLPRRPTEQPIIWPIGEGGTIAFAVTGTDGAAYDLSDQTLTVVCRRHLDDPEPTFAVEAVNDEPGQGESEPGTAAATFESDTTAAMLAGVVYWYDVRMADEDDQNQQVVPLSKWTPGPVVARDGEPPPEDPPA